MSVRFSTKPLGEKELRLLLHTPDASLTRVFPDYSRDFLRSERRRAREVIPTEVQLDLDRERARAAAEVKEVTMLYEGAKKRIMQLEDELNVIADLPSIHPRVVKVESGLSGEREATAVAVASDWHAEENVFPEQVNELNSFDLQTFKRRSDKFFTNVIKLIRKESNQIAINRLVLAFLGDLMTGNIHLDCALSCSLGPMDAAALVQDTIAGGILTLLEALPDINITVPFLPGNHSRITQHQYYSNEHTHALEWYIGYSLAREFKDNSRVEFVRQRSYLTYLVVHNTTLRLHHGHSLRYNGGVGGITIPVNKAIAEWNKGHHADLDVFGHFHQLFFGPNFVANGSLIGYNPYAISIKAAYQPPQQAFFLIDSKYGPSVRTPIFLDEPVQNVPQRVLSSCSTL